VPTQPIVFVDFGRANNVGVIVNAFRDACGSRVLICSNIYLKLNLVAADGLQTAPIIQVIVESDNVVKIDDTLRLVGRCSVGIFGEE
jgi:hypothetical protein